MFAGIGMMLYVLLWLALVVFLLTMLYRLVKAVERIADEIKNGITIKTKEAP
jgi:4-hydroxybenzoate polyprenyltransferase